MTFSVLIIEDAKSLAASYADVLHKIGCKSDVAGDLTTARSKLKSGRYDAILLDMLLPDGDGWSVLRDMNADGSGSPIIAVTSDGSISRAIEATRLGAFDFLVKPVSKERLTQAVVSACRATPKRMAAPRTKSRHGITGSSPQMDAVRSRIDRVASSGATVFITGESGVWKELCAQAVHAASARSSGPFIALNCGAIPGDLLESEVFGHLKGSFTGAISDKTGAVGAANGGTLFLDELCEMDVRLQTKLLRFLETATITPVGATSPRSIDVKIICATNRDPQAEVAAGRFREDLYYRLFVLPVDIPPLRDRGGDVLEIAESMLHQISKEEGKSFSGFSRDAKRSLLAAKWPGNVWELPNVIRQAVVMENGGNISQEALMLPSYPVPLRQAAPNVTSLQAVTPDPTNALNSETHSQNSEEGAAEILCRLPMVEIERLIIDAAIKHFGSAPKAARSLRVSPSTIYRKKESWDGRGTDVETN